MQTTLPREIKGAATTGASACRAQYGSDCGKHAATRQDKQRSVVLGPEHDWSSNAADAFGYMAIAYEEPPVKSMTIRRSPQPRARSPFTPGHHQASESRSGRSTKRRAKCAEAPQDAADALWAN